MGTRGLRVYRLRKRYYALYNNYDSYPEGLGKTIVAEIPSDPSEYQAWLASQRAIVAQWEAQYDKFITIVPGNKFNYPVADGKQEEGEDKGDEETPAKKIPAYMEHQFPSFFTPLNDTFIEWVYTLDLDDEKFTVSNGAHFALERMPHIQWIPALDKSSLGSQIIMPGAVQDEAIVDLIAAVESHVQTNALMHHVGDLTVEESPTSTRKLVTPKGVGDFPWKIRHGAILRHLWFFFWSKAKEDVLATTLLQLTSSDLLFREMAFAVVCMAAGGSNVTVFSQNHLSNNAAFGFIKGNKNEYDGSSEFFRVLGSGARRDGESSGSAPKEATYWFEGVLIVLTTQLFRTDAVEQGIKGVARYCQTQYPDLVVDAILLSIEHVVLIHIVPASTGHGAEIQHSSILPLFEIQEHLTMKTADRFAESYLSQLANPADEKFQRRQRIQKRKAMQERMLKNEGISMHFGDEEEDDASDDADQEDDLLHPTQVDGSTGATFYALQHVFSSAAGRRLRPSQQGCFPTEIYEHILSFVTDNATRDACLHTSHILREICLKEYLFCEADGSLLQPCEASKGCVEPDDLPKWFNLANVKTGRQMEASFNRGGCSFLDWDTKQDWTVMVGSGYGKKSLLSEATFKFLEYTD